MAQRPAGGCFFPNPARPGPSPALFGPFFGPSLAHSGPGGRHPVRRRGRAGVALHEGRALFLMPWRGEGYRHGHDRGAAVEAFHRHRTRGQWQNAQHPGYGPWPCHRRVFASSMGGAIEAEIAPGQGSSYHVVLIFGSRAGQAVCQVAACDWSEIEADARKCARQPAFSGLKEPGLRRPGRGPAGGSGRAEPRSLACLRRTKRRFGFFSP